MFVKYAGAFVRPNDTTAFLGHVLLAKGVVVDPSKIEAVSKW
jgi:hypothetical protein